MIYARLFFLLLFLGGLTGTARAVEIQEVTSPGGIKAWLVVDHKLPLLAMNFAFHGGVEQDPADKQGLADVTMDLLTEGAGPYDSSSFQQQLSNRTISLNFDAERDALTGQLKTLVTDKAKAFELLKLALTKPHFDKNDLERIRLQHISAIKMQFASPEWQARYALLEKLFPNHPYSQRHLGTLRTINNISLDDVKIFATDHLAKDNLFISVAGDISPKELAADLDRVFGGLPAHAKNKLIADPVAPHESSLLLTARAGTQTALVFAMPGPKRSDADWYATEIANYILGGGGFSSRLMQEIRDKRGLTYGIGTSLVSMDQAGLIMGQAAIDNSKTTEAWDLLLATLHALREDGVTMQEINAAKDYLTGVMPLSMTSTDRIAEVLVRMQLDHLGIDYLTRHNELIRSVTAADVNAAVKRWFNPDIITASFVGKPDDLAPTQTHSLVRE